MASFTLNNTASEIDQAISGAYQLLRDQNGYTGIVILNGDDSFFGSLNLNGSAWLSLNSGSLRIVKGGKIVLEDNSNLAFRLLAKEHLYCSGDVGFGNQMAISGRAYFDRGLVSNSGIIINGNGIQHSASNPLFNVNNSLFVAYGSTIGTTGTLTTTKNTNSIYLSNTSSEIVFNGVGKIRTNPTSSAKINIFTRPFGFSTQSSRIDLNRNGKVDISGSAGIYLRSATGDINVSGDMRSTGAYDFNWADGGFIASKSQSISTKGNLTFVNTNKSINFTNIGNIGATTNLTLRGEAGGAERTQVNLGTDGEIHVSGSQNIHLLGEVSSVTGFFGVETGKFTPNIKAGIVGVSGAFLIVSTGDNKWGKVALSFLT